MKLKTVVACCLVVIACSGLDGVSTASLPPSFPAAGGTSWMGECGNNKEEAQLFHDNVHKLQNCYNHLFEAMNQLGNSPLKDSRAYLEEQCGDYMEYAGCVDTFMREQLHCFPTLKQADMKVTANGTRFMFTELCNLLRQQAVLEGLIPGAMCIAEKKPQVMLCFSGVDSNSKVSIIDPLSIMNGDYIAMGLLEMDYSPDTCRQSVNLVQCMTNVFSQCPNHSMGTLLTQVFYSFLRVTPCAAFVNQQQPPPPPVLPAPAANPRTP